MAASAPTTIYSLIVPAKRNDVDPRTWLAYVLARINDHKASRLDELLLVELGACTVNHQTPRFSAGGYQYTVMHRDIRHLVRD